MSKSLNIIWQYLRAFVLIYACLYAGIFIASLLPITIPGSIIGMLKNAAYRFDADPGEPACDPEDWEALR